MSDPTSYGPGDPAEAAELEEALANAGELHEAGELEQAETIYRNILERYPDHPGTLHRLGIVALQTQHLDSAIELIEKAIAGNAANPDYHGHLGLARFAKGDFQGAEQCYRSALAFDEGHLDSRINLGNVLLQTGRVDEAEAEYNRALEADPASETAHYGLALAHLGRNDLDAAADALLAALKIAPDFLAARINLSNLLLQKGQADAAVANLREAVRLVPESFDARLNLGVALQQANKPGDAVAVAKETLALSPDSPELLLNLGAAHLANGEPAAACDALDRALAAAPDYAPARLNRAMACLVAGNFEDGWHDYEARPSRGVLPDPGIAELPEWDGGDPAGKRILVWAEQGYGDAIQFARYLPMLAERGATVFFHVPPPLARLFEGLGGIERLLVRDRDTELPDVDAQIPLLSLPYRMATTLETIPAKPAYLTAPTAEDAEPSGDTRRIGLCWQGSATNPNDLRRSVDPGPLVEALDRPGIELIGLQYGAEGAPLDNPGGMVGDFAGMAALIQGLDLVVTVDTGVAHLAGALGKPVWTLLPFAPDWRWLLDRDDSPWYPSMRLFRQPSPGDWTAAFRDISAALDEWLAG